MRRRLSILFLFIILYCIGLVHATSTESSTSLSRILFGEDADMDQQLTQTFSQSDLNQDGRLSMTELRSMIKRFTLNGTSFWDLPGNFGVESQSEDGRHGATLEVFKAWMKPIATHNVPVNITKCEELKQCQNIEDAYNQCLTGWHALEGYWLQNCIAVKGCSCMKKEKKRAANFISTIGSWAVFTVDDAMANSSTWTSWQELFQQKGLNESYADSYIGKFAQKNQRMEQISTSEADDAGHLFTLKSWATFVRKSHSQLLKNLWANVYDTTASAIELPSVTEDELQDWFHEEITRPKEIPRDLCLRAHQKYLYSSFHDSLVPSIFNWNPLKVGHTMTETTKETLSNVQSCLQGHSLWTNYAWELCVDNAFDQEDGMMHPTAVHKRLVRKCGSWRTGMEKVLSEIPARAKHVSLHKRSLPAILVLLLAQINFAAMFVVAAVAIAFILPFTIPSFIHLGVSRASKRNEINQEKTIVLIKGMSSTCKTRVYWGSCGWIGSEESRACPEGGRLVYKNSCKWLHSFSSGGSKMCSKNSESKSKKSRWQGLMLANQFKCESLCVRADPPGCMQI